MNRRSLRLARRIATATLLLAGTALADVDPAWLASWNEAVATRPATISKTARIGEEGEPGEPLIIQGQVTTPDGAPAAGVDVLAYHRDAAGFEFGQGDRQTTTWRLRAWARTDDSGEFTFVTIRPAPDALGREAPHVHFTLVSDAWGRQWAPKESLCVEVELMRVHIRLKPEPDF